ncbi:hypothetical protein ACWGID_39260 [Kribbella sp. NPDC054772]
MSAETSLAPVARAHSIVGFTTCACLLVFYAAGEPFGVFNDVGNAVLGVLSLVLARCLLAPIPEQEDIGSAMVRRGLLLAAAAAGAALTVVGTVLVLTGVTGFYLAGLWSSLGFALIGIWLIGVRGILPGVVMLLGLVGLPGILIGLDDMDSAPPWAFVAGLSWAGTYLLFPTWSLRLARQHRAEGVG